MCSKAPGSVAMFFIKRTLVSFPQQKYTIHRSLTGAIPAKSKLDDYYFILSAWGVNTSWANEFNSNSLKWVQQHLENHLFCFLQRVQPDKRRCKEREEKAIAIYLHICNNVSKHTQRSVALIGCLESCLRSDNHLSQGETVSSHVAGQITQHRVNIWSSKL